MSLQTIKQNNMGDRLTSPLKSKKKAVSLPKIREVSEETHRNKGMQNIHKVKWSIAPKCLIPGHEGKQILYVCINPECTQQTRLICEQCFFKNHSKHNQKFLAVDEVKKGQIQKLRYWPFGVQYRKMFQFITKHQAYVHNMVQDVNATFNSMAMRILSSIDKIRLKLLKKIDNFYIRQTTKQKFSQKIKTDLEQCFQLKKISQTVRQLFSKEIRHEIFQYKMRNLLNDEQVKKERQSLLNYFNSAEKGKDMLFDKMHFAKKQSWILEQINEQKKSLKEQVVTIDQADMGIQKIIVQTIDYLDKHAEGMYPLTFEKKEIEDGSIYNGFIYKGLRSLFGMRLYKNGYVYYGEWKNGAKSGWGIYENKDIGYRYAGEWKEDRKWGYGRQSTIKWIYEGNYVADKKEGFGVFIEEGIRYEVTYKNDKKNGQGKRIQKNGDEIQIYYLNGVESKAKVGKSAPSFDIKQLSKRFSSVKSHDALSTNEK